MSEGFRNIVNEPENQRVINEFIYFAIGIAVIPCSIVLSGYYLSNNFNLYFEKSTIMMMAAILAVVAVNVGGILYAVKSYYEEKKLWQMESTRKSCIDLKERRNNSNENLSSKKCD